MSFVLNLLKVTLYSHFAPNSFNFIKYEIDVNINSYVIELKLLFWFVMMMYLLKKR